jgi:hypothetical protein
MGASSSSPLSSSADFHLEKLTNDYELVLRVSKELEALLLLLFAAEGSGLHERVSACGHQLSPELIRSLRLVATVRNKLVHDFHVHAIEDRQRFVSAYVASREALLLLKAQRQQQQGQHSSKKEKAQGGSGCSIM